MFNVKKIHSNISIKGKILSANIIIVVFTIIIFGLFSYYSSTTNIKKHTYDAAFQTINLAKSNILSSVRDIENTLFSVQANQTIQNTLKSNTSDMSTSIGILESELLRVDIFKKSISSITLYALNRPDFPNIYKAGAVLSDAVVINEPWYKQTLRLNGKTNWNLFRNYNYDGYFSASRIIIDTSGSINSPLAVARVDIDILPSISMLNGLSLGSSGKIFLVKDSQILYMDNQPTVKKMVNNKDFFNAINNPDTKKSNIIIDNINYYVMNEDLDDTGIKVVGLVKTDELDASANVVAQTMLFAGCLSLLIAFAFALLVSHRISNPIHILGNEMKEFENNLDNRVKVSSTDEIGFLYRSYNKMLDKINSLIENIKTLHEQQKISEFKALQAQINPHFLYNTLDSINWLAQKHNADEIVSIVSALGNFFRHSLNNGNEFITLENELKQIENYVEIQKIRFKDAFSLEIHVDKDLQKYTFIKLTLQPLVENCIVHAFGEINHKGLICIKGHEKNGYLYVDVIDNGSGADIDMLNDSLLQEVEQQDIKEKYGIYNVNKRLKLFFNEECGLSFSRNEYGGLTATLKVKII